MMRISIFSSLVFLLLFSCSSPPPAAISREAEAASEPVRPEVAMQFAYYAAQDSLHLHIKFEDVRQVLDLEANAAYVDYKVRAGKTEDSPLLLSDSVVVVKQAASQADGNVYVSFSIPQYLAVQPNTVQLRLWQQSDDGLRLGTYAALPLDAAMLEKNYLLLQTKTGKPLFRSYVSIGDELVVRKYSELLEPIELSRVPAAFAPALPPMSLRQETAPRTMQIVATEQYTDGDTLVFASEGLYLVERKTPKSKGVLVMPGGFPQLTKSHELIAPLIYLTTSKEREALLSVSDPKLAVDNFWLKVAGNKEQARELIREYYSRVETANRIYTSHKAGWATDRGMISIIYGQPTSINRTADTETWTYHEVEAEPFIKFVFNKKENNFTENHYELVRYREYAENWYSKVAKWRAGITDM